MESFFGEEEDMIEFGEKKESDFILFIKGLIQNPIKEQMKLSDEEGVQGSEGWQNRPLGIFRSRIVEFLAACFSQFFSELVGAFEEY